MRDVCGISRGIEGEKCNTSIVIRRLGLGSCILTSNIATINRIVDGSVLNFGRIIERNELCTFNSWKLELDLGIKVSRFVHTQNPMICLDRSKPNGPESLDRHHSCTHTRHADINVYMCTITYTHMYMNTHTHRHIYLWFSSYETIVLSANFIDFKDF